MGVVKVAELRRDFAEAGASTSRDRAYHLQHLNCQLPSMYKDRIIHDTGKKGSVICLAFVSCSLQFHS
jgi:hypothetical protein